MSQNILHSQQQLNKTTYGRKEFKAENEVYLVLKVFADGKIAQKFKY